MAIRNLEEICEEHLKGRYRLEVVDLYRRPEVIEQEQIVAAPTVVKRLPLPIRRLVGDMADKQRVLVGLGLKR
jgi:circadian clock protein KaiB